MEKDFYKAQLEDQIDENENLIQIIESKNSLLYTLKLQRILFVITTIFLLIAILLFYFVKYKGLQHTIASQNAKISRTSIKLDSFAIYKKGYYKSIELMYPQASEKKLLENEEIVYGVQIGAYKDFELVSKELTHLDNFKSNEYNKFCIGHYTTYKEAFMLKSKLIKLGFKDAFLSAKSFGEPLDIREALVLSNEEQFLK